MLYSTLVDTCIEISAPLPSLSNSAQLSTQMAYCRWEDETTLEGVIHPLSYDKDLQMKSLTLPTGGCLRTGLKAAVSLVPGQLI